MMTRSLTDSAVIAVSRDDPTAFAAIFDRHYDSIHAYVRRRLGRDLADELASETFLRAFEARRRYDLARPDARPWLFGIVANLARRHGRDERRKFRAFALSGVDPLMEMEALNGAEARIDAQRAGPRIALALTTLRAVDREILLLFAWADLSYQEISAALGLPIGTVRSRLSRARKRLRELLAPIGQEPDAGAMRNPIVQEETQHG